MAARREHRPAPAAIGGRRPGPPAALRPRGIRLAGRDALWITLDPHARARHDRRGPLRPARIAHAARAPRAAARRQALAAPPPRGDARHAGRARAARGGGPRRGRSGGRRGPGRAHVDALAAERHVLRLQQPPLAPPFASEPSARTTRCHGTVSSSHADSTAPARRGAPGRGHRRSSRGRAGSRARGRGSSRRRSDGVPDFTVPKQGIGAGRRVPWSPP